MAAAIDAADMDDFNSSDIEMPEKEDAFAHAGSDSIASMLERQFDDRVSSKIASKQLTQVKGAPLTQRTRALWSQRFKAFCIHTLKHKPDRIPTGEDIERHLFVIVDHLRPRGAHKELGQISYSCIYNGLKWIVNSLRFSVKGFKLEKRDYMRLDNVVATLLKEGKITKNPIHEKQWIGTNIIFGMAKSIFKDALENGTLSWDVTICRVLSVVLQAALCSRSGDIAVSKGYDEMICMRFEHIKIKLVRRDGVEHLEGMFEMAFGKGLKDNQARNPKKKINALIDANFNVICPLKLILIHALRIGAVDDHSIEDLLAATRRRVDKTIQWKHGAWPVLPAFQNRARGIVHDKAARTNNFLANLRLGGDLLGVKKPIITHDVRRGAAADIAAHSSKITMGKTDAVSDSLDHSEQALRMGVTKGYMGKQNQDVWQLRVSEMASVDDAFDVEVAPLPFKRRKYTDDELTTQYCLDNGLDPQKGSDRRRASLKIRDAERSAHFSGQTFVDDPMLDAVRKPITALSNNPSAVNKDMVKKSQLPGSFASADMSKTSSSTSSFTLVAAVLPGEEMIDPQLRSNRFAGGDDEQQEISPELMNFASTINGIVTGGADATTEDILENFFDPSLCDALTEVAPKELTQEPMKFVDFFSRINILCSDHEPTNQVAGGSRDEWTRFKHKCRNHMHGCLKTFDRVSEENRHSVGCKYGSEEAADAEKSRLSAPRPHECEKCGKTFEKKEALQQHVKKCGTSFIAKPCSEEGCDPKVIFKTQGTWNSHRMDNHGSFTARGCPLKDVCGTETVWSNRGSYRSHLVRTHRLTGQELAQYMPGVKGADKGKNRKRKN